MSEQGRRGQRGLIVTPLLGVGRKNALHAGELAARLGCSTREIRKCVEFERHECRVPIIGSDAGLYLPGDPMEVRACRARFASHNRSIVKTLAVLDEYLSEEDSQ